MPALLPVTAASVNYAPVVLVGFALIAVVWYFIWGRKHYRGPPSTAFDTVVPQGPLDSVDVSPHKKD